MTKNEIIAKWPLFKVSNATGGPEWITIDTKKGIWTVKESLSQKEIDQLDAIYNSVNEASVLMKQYPNLYISVTEKEITAWVLANGRDREGFGSIKRSDISKLKEFNDLAADAASNPNIYFLCSCCKETLLIKEPSKNVLLNNKDLNIERLVGYKRCYLKFQSAGADYWCDHCTENDSRVKQEYAIYKKMGSKYYD